MSVARLAPIRRFVFLLVLLAPVLVLGQGAKITPPGMPASANPEADRDRVREREAWFRRGRTAPAGQNAAELLYRAYRQKMKMRADRLAAESAAALNGASGPKPASFNPNNWNALGPAPSLSDPGGFQSYGPVSGRVTAVAVDPNDTTGNTVYIGGADGGVWKTTNGACGSAGTDGDTQSCVTWTNLTDLQASLHQGAIAVQPGNAVNTVILVGTGEPDNAGPLAQPDSYFGVGILRSTNGGSTWSLIGSADSGTHTFKGMGFSKIAFNTLNNQKVVAAAAATFTLGAPLSFVKGLYFSGDAGTTWSLSSIFDGATQICLATSGPLPRGCSATSVVFNPNANGGLGAFYAAVRFHGYYFSTDNGATFHRMTNQPDPTVLTTGNCPTATNSATCPIERGEITVRPGGTADNFEMYTIFVDLNDNNEDVWRLTTDASGDATGGTNWASMNAAGGGGINNCQGTGGGEGVYPGDNTSGCGTQQGSFDLFIAAVPNSTNTDLYVGSVNIFKCTPQTTTNCTTGSGWLNLTHTYGCLATQPTVATLAHVHPDQHAIDFSVNHPNIIYFGNDGGMYRTINSAGLNTNDCSKTNAFDNINQTLGSLATVISFSQNFSGGLGTISQFMVGLQDDGSPVVDIADAANFPPSAESFQWTNANAGDGGFNAFDVTNTAMFTTNTGPSMQRCFGTVTNCRVNNFSPTVGNAQLGNDSGPFYTTFILDPLSVTTAYTGTCRVWESDTGGASNTAISFNLDQNNTNVNFPCSGGESDVAGLAAGGPKGTNNLSKVIYAGTTGGSAGSPGGEIWVTTNADAAPPTWTNTTGHGPGNTNINPGNFVVSDIGIDRSIAGGQTAYLTIMGFTGGAGHVWQTTNAGGSWTDITGTGPGALPDAPVSSVVVDPRAGKNGTIYVGTDVGVFTTSNVNGASTVWTEFGPVGLGELPHSPVMRLLAVDGGAGKQFLTAGIYGRGLWQISLAAQPDYSLAISNSPQQAYVTGSAAVFNGTATATLGYNSPVDLTCTNSPPSTCTPATTPVTPTNGGAAFTVTATNTSAGDFTFNAHGVGQDANHLVHDAPMTLHVVDFTLAASVNPVPITIPNSGNTTITVKALGTFTDTVSLVCRLPLPAGVTCGFGKNNFVPAGGAGTGSLLTIGTTTATPVGASVIHVDVTPSSGGAPTKTQDVTINVSADYALAIGAVNPQTVYLANLPAVFNGTATDIGAFPATVALSCISGTSAPPTTCTPAPNPVTPTGPGQAVTVSTSNATVGDFNFKLHGIGTDANVTTHDAAPAMTLHIVDFMAVSPNTVGNPVPIQHSESGTGTVTVTALGSAFSDTVQLSCPGPLPTGMACAFPVNNTQPTAAGTNYSVVISTTSATPVGAVAVTVNVKGSSLGAPTKAATVNVNVLPGLGFVPITPCRVADTRGNGFSGPFGPPFLTGNAPGRSFPISASPCMPVIASGAKPAAYSLNLTVVPHGGLGFITAFPCGAAQPLASNLNSNDGRVKAVAAIVPAGTSPAGSVCVFASNDTDLVIDINGFFLTSTDPSTPLAFFPVTPCRVVDTRNNATGGPTIPGGATRTFNIQGAATPCNVPTVAQAYSLNYTAVPQGTLGFLTTWPTGQPQPTVSTLNAPTGTVVANAAIVPAGAPNGELNVFVSNTSDVVIDINGYFAPFATGTGGNPALSLYTLTPCRVLDTRTVGGAFSSPIDITVTGTNALGTNCGAATSALAFVLNATVVPPGPLGFLTLWPGPKGTTPPVVSTLNASDGFVTSNLAIVPTATGKISATASNPTQLVLDLSGYFGP